MIKELFKKNKQKGAILIFFLASFFITFFSYSQNSREEVVKRYLNIGKQLITQGNYDSASIILKSAFITNAVLPDELLYYYSYSLFKQGELDQSKKLVDKFLSISSNNVELYDRAVSLSTSIEASIDKESTICTHCNGQGVHVHSCTHCNETGEQKCETCLGKGKILVGGTAGMKFGICTTCMGDGLQTCKVCKGRKELEEVCEVCKGKGKIRKKMEAKK